ncbi:MAG: hypothetical protein EBU31_00440 [Proteobacteria bacterium]|nr:hypothetical protein [Pseudomonadota bacterium]
MRDGKHFGSAGCCGDDEIVLGAGTTNQIGSVSGSVNARGSRIGSGHTGRAVAKRVDAHAVSISSSVHGTVIGRGFGIGLLRDGLGLGRRGMIDGLLVGGRFGLQRMDTLELVSVSVAALEQHPVAEQRKGKREREEVDSARREPAPACLDLALGGQRPAGQSAAQ